MPTCPDDIGTFYFLPAIQLNGADEFRQELGARVSILLATFKLLNKKIRFFTFQQPFRDDM